ncbi:reverse transcriptase domain-containing protein [Tanacetum coccineum]
MDGINIDDLTIKQYFRLTHEDQTPSMVKKFNYNIGSDEEAGDTTDMESVMSEHEANDLAHVIDTWSLEEEISSEEDLDEWLKAEMEKHMSKHNEKREENALIAITNSIREEYIINNDSLTSNLSCQPSLEELNPGSFLLPFTIDNYNSYDMANIDASDNVMPRGIYEYLKLANLGETTMSVEMDDITQQETLGMVNNVLVKIDKFEFPCDFVVTDMPANLGEMIILGRPFLETIHAQMMYSIKKFH